MTENNLYSIPPFIAASLSFLLGVFVCWKVRKSYAGFSLSILCFSIAVWLYSYSLCYSSADEETALFWARNSYLGIILIPIAVYQLAITLLKIKRFPKLFFFYVLGGIFLFLSRTDFFFSHVKIFFWGYYPQAAILYHPFLVFFFGLYSYACLLIFFALKNTGIPLLKRNQLKYIFIAYLTFFAFLPPPIIPPLADHTVANPPEPNFASAVYCDNNIPGLILQLVILCSFS